jgi:hypothetical protein
MPMDAIGTGIIMRTVSGFADKIIIFVSRSKDYRQLVSFSHVRKTEDLNSALFLRNRKLKMR